MSTLTRGWNSNNKSTQIKDMAAEPSIRYGLTRERISTTFFGMLRQLPSTSRSPASFLKENQPLFRSGRLDLLFSIPGGQHSVKALQDHSFMCQVQHKTSSSHALHCVHDAPRVLWGRRQCHKTRWSRKTLTRSPYSQWRLCVCCRESFTKLSTARALLLKQATDPWQTSMEYKLKILMEKNSLLVFRRKAGEVPRTPPTNDINIFRKACP